MLLKTIIKTDFVGSDRQQKSKISSHAILEVSQFRKKNTDSIYLDIDGVKW
jgi:hypothetical protein